jgi:peptide/nickel transport system substrate-binding protein
MISKALAGLAVLVLAASAARAERGADGEVRVLYWQAVSTMQPYLSNGAKDLDAASLVVEPLARFDEEGAMVPFLAEAIPTIENGGIAADLTSVTWTLKDGLVWSDGTPVTAEDVVFTWQYCVHPEGGCSQLPNFDGVAQVEALDPRTVKVSFADPKPYPYGPFVGVQAPIIQKAQFADCLGARAPSCTEANARPIGTGPFRVTDFRANDVVTFEANPRYRDPAKPAFATLILKGGGDAASAARAVLETAEFDYAWNAQIEPEILAEMLKGGKGEVIAAFGTNVERLHLNQTDPDPTLGPERSTAKHPHPFLTDPDVARALSLAIDREIIVEVGYGAAGRVTCNIVPAPEINASTANQWCLRQDLEEANRLLDAAGWTMGADGVRAKDGRRLSVLYQTSTNSVRQTAQALIKQWWNEIGVEVELRNIDAGVFFGGDPGSPDTFQKFYADVEMLSAQFDDAEKYLGDWVCAEIPGPENQWQGANISRWCSPDYDALHAELGRTAGAEARGRIIVRLNDMIVNSPAYVPLVWRGRVSVKSTSLGGVVMNPFDSELWNAADWYREN